GDRVSIELHSGSVFTASLIMYGIPLVALLAGVLIGSFISDLFTAVFGIGAAVIALLIIRLFEPKFKKMGKFDPRMIEIVSE
ncbi:MAG: SoxR reducing system RseC family protein, partial [Clostridia bacterium]|nr:SoxR reducing system RseC family protein [Clostridia bacterium]